jgi:hypothetical protein
MPHRWPLLLLVVSMLIGYTVGRPPAQAQTELLPFSVGDTVTLFYGQDAAQPSFGGSIDCAVAEIRGVYVRCGSRSQMGERGNQIERWLTMKYVVQITKRVE